MRRARRRRRRGRSRLHPWMKRPSQADWMQRRRRGWGEAAAAHNGCMIHTRSVDHCWRRCRREGLLLSMRRRRCEVLRHHLLLLQLLHLNCLRLNRRRKLVHESITEPWPNAHARRSGNRASLERIHTHPRTQRQRRLDCGSLRHGRRMGKSPPAAMRLHVFQILRDLLRRQHRQCRI